MQYYMLDKNDISVVRGIVNTKDVMRELGITNAQFHKMLRNEETYKGCILLPVETDEEERRKVTSEDDEQFQLIGHAWEVHTAAMKTKYVDSLGPGAACLV